ncbi:MAG: DUF4347 domain-containing protein [Methylococcales bacterium]
MIRLERPNMAINDPRVRTGPSVLQVRRYQMENTWDIATTESRQHIINWVVNVAHGTTNGKLKNLVLSCHGNPGQLQLGQGFDISQVALFSAWRGLIEKIWLPDCLVARGSDGNAFCSSMARQAQCYVVAPTESQCDEFTTMPYDQLTSFEGLVLCYGPNGNISWQGRNMSSWDYENNFGNWIIGRQGCVGVPD